MADVCDVEFTLYRSIDMLTIFPIVKKKISNQCPERISRYIEWWLSKMSLSKLNESGDGKRHCAHVVHLHEMKEGRKMQEKGREKGQNSPGEIGSLRVVRAGLPDYLISLMDS